MGDAWTTRQGEPFLIPAPANGAGWSSWMMLQPLTPPISGRCLYKLLIVIETNCHPLWPWDITKVVWTWEKPPGLACATMCTVLMTWSRFRFPSRSPRSISAFSRFANRSNKQLEKMCDLLYTGRLWAFVGRWSRIFCHMPHYKNLLFHPQSRKIQDNGLFQQWSTSVSLQALRTEHQTQATQAMRTCSTWTFNHG